VWGAGTISILSDQLTAYQLAKPEAEQTALCVLVKTFVVSCLFAPAINASISSIS